jgi:hypothetical protein
MPGSAVGPVPIIRVYGVNEIGNSVLCNVHGFTPYFFVPAPPNFQRSDCETFRAALNVPTFECGDSSDFRNRNEWNPEERTTK